MIKNVIVIENKKILEKIMRACQKVDDTCLMYHQLLVYI